MAVTKIWRVRGKAQSVIDYVKDPEKTVSTLSEEDLGDIADVLEYVDDEVKTEKHFYTTGIGCDRDNAKEEFELTKKRFGKELVQALGKNKRRCIWNSKKRFTAYRTA
jgi:hypothetical protein